MSDEIIQSLCERGQQSLMAMNYLQARRLLAQAEALAWQTRQWEVLSRLYLPLQETHRQIRQRCGEGNVCLDLLADGPNDQPDPLATVERLGQGQVLIAGWAFVEPGVQLRRQAEKLELYLETFLAAVYPTDAGRVVVIVPSQNTVLPEAAAEQSSDELLAALPPNCVALGEKELPSGVAKGSPQTYARVMELWERLHGPLLAAADAEQDLVRRMAGYRRAIEADAACELAHQHLSEAAKEMARRAS